MYTCTTHRSRYYSIFDNAERCSFSAFYPQIPLDLWVLYNEMHQIDSNLTEFVAQQARAGVNTLLLYTCEYAYKMTPQWIPIMEP